MMPSLSEDLQERLYTEVIGLKRAVNSKKSESTSNPSENPVQVLLKDEKFDEHHLLSSYPEWVLELYAEYIRDDRIKTHSFEKIDPTHIRDYIDVTDTLVSKIKETYLASGDTSEFHIFNPSLLSVTNALCKLCSKFSMKFWKIGGKGEPEEYKPADLLSIIPPEALANQPTEDETIEAGVDDEINDDTPMDIQKER